MLWLSLPVLAASALQAAAPVVLRRAYSHNDYEQPRALADALDRGFFAVEADVHLRGDELFVAHTGGGIKPGRTLRSLYLDPLLARVKANGGVVHPGGPKGFLLMVELKSEGESSYRLLREMLVPYRSMLTRFSDGAAELGAVTIVITGRRPREVLAAEAERWAAIDGDLSDLGGDAALYPVVSADWRAHFSWRSGRMEEAERRKLARYADQARAGGRELRFYAIPDREEAWELLLAAGVTLINTDRLEALARFLERRLAGDGRRALEGASAVAGRPEFTPSSRP
jgi:hypothetical protein